MKKLLLLALTLALFVVGIGAVGSQDSDNTAGGSVRRVVQIVAEAAGLEPREIVAKLREGLTLADIISARGGDVAAVSAEVQAVLTEEIETALANGRITQERADQMLTNLESFIAHAMNGELRRETRPVNRLEGAVLNLAAEQTGLTRREIIREIRMGKSLADVLTENGVEVNAFVDAVVTQLTERAAQAVTEGRLTQAEADALVQRFHDGLRERLTQTSSQA